MRRILARLYAFTHGYFWLPCPICGNMYGGHESKGRLLDSWSSGRLICYRHECLKEADERNRALMASLPPPPVILT